MERVLVSWSGGKDSAMALAEILSIQHYEVAALMTTVTRDYQRVSMHGVRRTLLERQAESIGLPLEEVSIPKNASNEEYESSMGKALAKYQDSGVSSVVFGDIFLEDLRKYREEKLGSANMRCLFPIWKRETKELARSFIAAGFKAVTTCVDTTVLGEHLAGREIDESFLSELPPGADPCGENGEYHTFVYDGPIFKKRIQISLGEKVLRENRFYYCDLVEV
ncbi:MAG: diphthine--ammonia ligase [Bacteroidota bacterium]